MQALCIYNEYMGCYSVDNTHYAIWKNLKFKKKDTDIIWARVCMNIFFIKDKKKSNSGTGTGCYTSCYKSYFYLMRLVCTNMHLLL